MTARTPSPRACWTCSSAPARAACPWLWPRATPITPPMATPSAARPWPPTPITAWSASPLPMASPCPWLPCPTAWSTAPMSPWAARTWPIRTAPPSARTRTPSPSAACPPGAPSSMWWCPTTAPRPTMRAWMFRARSPWSSGAAVCTTSRRSAPPPTPAPSVCWCTTTSPACCICPSPTGRFPARLSPRLPANT